VWREGWVWVGKGLLRGVRSHSCAHLREGGRKERESLGRSVGGGRKSALGRGSTKGGNVNRREPDGCSPGRGKEPCAALLHCTAALPTDTSRCSCRGSSPVYTPCVCVCACACVCECVCIHPVVIVEDHRPHIRRMCKCVCVCV
jgi:hypothetical protein